MPQVVLNITPLLLVAAFVFFTLGTWNVSRGRAQLRPLGERAFAAAMFAFVGWQAAVWLWADHADASPWRVAAVWLQLLSAFGVAVVLLVQGWFVSLPPRRDRTGRQASRSV